MGISQQGPQELQKSAGRQWKQEGHRGKPPAEAEGHLAHPWGLTHPGRTCKGNLGESKQNRRTHLGKEGSSMLTTHLAF